MTITVDVRELETKVRALYRDVAARPYGTYHFALGRPLAEQLGYPADLLDQVPVRAVESFAGVGYFLDLAGLRPGERVLDLGSGSGMDSFCAARLVGASGRVTGVDFTSAQVDKANLLAIQARSPQIGFRYGRIEALPEPPKSADCVISNGVINLCPDKARVFAEVARVLRPGGRMAIADIVTTRPLKDSIVCDADLWASCIGGAAQRDAYRAAIEGAGLRIVATRENPYQFLSDRARDATTRYGVKSISLLATKA
ncbi:MAG: methyltransferase domain-containing protein [Micromonosporaceae bacterium]